MVWLVRFISFPCYVGSCDNDIVDCISAKVRESELTFFSGTYEFVFVLLHRGLEICR